MNRLWANTLTRQSWALDQINPIEMKGNKSTKTDFLYI